MTVLATRWLIMHSSRDSRRTTDLHPRTKDIARARAWAGSTGISPAGQEHKELAAPTTTRIHCQTILSRQSSEESGSLSSLREHGCDRANMLATYNDFTTT